MRYVGYQRPPLGAHVNWSHPLSAGLVGCWLLNEGSGNITYDLTMSGGTGTIVGSVSLLSGSAYFPGTVGSYIIVNDKDIYSFYARPFTIVSRIKPLSLVGMPILYKYMDVSPFDGEYSFSIGSLNSLYGQCLNNGPNARIRVEGSVSLVADKWASCAFRYKGGNDPSSLDLFLNGVIDLAPSTREKQGTYETMTNRATPVVLGAGLVNNVTYDQYFNGFIDFIYLYGRALTDNEINSLHRRPYQFFDHRPMWMDYTSTILAWRKIRDMNAGIDLLGDRVGGVF